MNGSPWRRRLPRVRTLTRHPETGLPPAVLLCPRCRCASGYSASWRYVAGEGFVCPFCLSRGSLRARIRRLLGRR